MPRSAAGQRADPLHQLDLVVGARDEIARKALLRSLIKRPVDRLKFVVLVFAHGSPVSSIAFRRPTLGPILNDGWQIKRGAQPPRAALIEHRMGRRAPEGRHAARNPRSAC